MQILTITNQNRHEAERCCPTHRIPDPLSAPTNRGRRITCKKPRHFWPLWASLAAGSRSLAAAAMDTGTPAPAVRLPLDPVPTHHNGIVLLLCRNPARDLIFRRGQHRRGNWLPSNSTWYVTAIAPSAAAHVARAVHKLIFITTRGSLAQRGSFLYLTFFR